VFGLVVGIGSLEGKQYYYYYRLPLQSIVEKKDKDKENDSFVTPDFLACLPAVFYSPSLSEVFESHSTPAVSRSLVLLLEIRRDYNLCMCVILRLPASWCFTILS